MYPPSFVRPTMKEALIKADFTAKQSDRVVDACREPSRVCVGWWKLFDGFTEEDMAAIAMHAYDFGARRVWKESIQNHQHKPCGQKLCWAAEGQWHLVPCDDSTEESCPWSLECHSTEAWGAKWRWARTTTTKGTPSPGLHCPLHHKTQRQQRHSLQKVQTVGKVTEALLIIEDGWGLWHSALLAVPGRAQTEWTEMYSEGTKEEAEKRKKKKEFCGRILLITSFTEKKARQQQLKQ